MIEIGFTASFMRESKKLAKMNAELREEIAEAIDLFKHRKNHQKLKVHKLHGNLKDFHSFSVNYQYRIIFEWITNNKAVFHDVDDHDMYR